MLDPITFEIIRHRLFRVIDEAVITLKRVSGSEIVNEAHDLIVSLHRVDGSLLLAGVGYTSRTPTAAEACKHIIKRFKNQINKEDIFFLNDPYTAAFHTSDIHLIAPIHHGDDLVAWSCCFVHVNDIGALAPGGFSPDSSDIYTEGFSSPGLKLVDQGEVREDLMDTIRNMVRTPEMVTLDIKSMIACHNVARDRMLELIGKYGRDAVDQAARALIEQSDRLLGERLAELPDGRWEARQRMEVKGEIYRVNLSLTKREGILTFDFDGSSPQSRYPINASYWTSWGALFSPIYAVLCPDITWNEGIAHHVRMTAPEGSVVNCKRPAPLSVATVAAANLVSMAALNCISKMLLASERHEKLATGGWNGGAISVFLYGKNQHGLMAISFLTDIFAGAGGARSWGDGMDVCGDIPNPIARFANIETIEARLPVRYIFRRRVCDSGGAGQYRGGAGIECGITPHDMSGSGLNFSICGKGTHYPATEGIVGGYVGSTCHYALLHHSDEPRGSSPVVWFDPGAHEFERQTTRVNWGIYPLRDNDVLYVRCSGGGGYGDPLKRDVAAVHRDYSLGLVSLRDAREIYGVVINEKSGEVDAIATPRRRRALVAQRLKEHGRQYAHVAEPDY